MNDWRDDLLPPIDVWNGVKSKLQITTKKESDMILCTCMGIKAWGFLPKFMRPSSAKWVYSVFGCEEYSPHTFFKYYLQEYRLTGFSIIEHTGCTAKIDPSTTYDDIRTVSMEIFPDVMEIATIPDSVIRTMLVEYVVFLRNDPEIIDGKRATDIYRGIDTAKQSNTDACIRSVRTSAVEYEYFDDVYPEPTYTFRCEYCGEEVACIQSTSNPICLKCLAKTGGDSKNIDCKHIECGSYACNNYYCKEEEERYDYVSRG